MKLLQLLKNVFIQEKQEKTVFYEIPKVIPQLTKQERFAIDDLEMQLMKNSKKGVK